TSVLHSRSTPPLSTLSLHDALPISGNRPTPTTAATSRSRACSKASADRLSPDAVLEPDRSPPDADHRRGDRGRRRGVPDGLWVRSEEHTSELQSLRHLVCRLLLEKK